MICITPPDDHAVVRRHRCQLDANNDFKLLHPAARHGLVDIQHVPGG